jgi:hypothetical protein
MALHGFHWYPIRVKSRGLPDTTRLGPLSPTAGAAVAAGGAVGAGGRGAVVVVVGAAREPPTGLALAVLSLVEVVVPPGAAGDTGAVITSMSVTSRLLFAATPWLLTARVGGVATEEVRQPSSAAPITNATARPRLTTSTMTFRRGR